MTEKHLQILSGLFLAGVVIYFISNRGAKEAITAAAKKAGKAVKDVASTAAAEAASS